MIARPSWKRKKGHWDDCQISKQLTKSVTADIEASSREDVVVLCIPFVLCLNYLKQTFTSCIWLFSDEKETSASWITFDVSQSLFTESSPIWAKSTKANSNKLWKGIVHTLIRWQLEYKPEWDWWVLTVIVIGRPESNDLESLQVTLIKLWTKTWLLDLVMLTSCKHRPVLINQWNSC